MLTYSVRTVPCTCIRSLNTSCVPVVLTCTIFDILVNYLIAARTYVRYPSQGNIMRYETFGRFCEYLGRVAYPPNFVGRPTGPFGASLPSFVTGTPDPDSRLDPQAPGSKDKFSTPQINAWQLQSLNRSRWVRSLIHRGGERSRAPVVRRAPNGAQGSLLSSDTMVHISSHDSPKFAQNTPTLGLQI